MDKRALKEFAVYARNELRRQISLRAATFGVTSKGCVTLHTGLDYVEVHREKYPISYKKSFEKLFHEIETKGYDNVIEEVAYTWFNRLIALRYLEVHDYLPSRIRVLSSETKGKIDPDILTEYRNADLPESTVSEVSELLNKNQREEAYRKLLVAQCNELHNIMQFLFEKVTDYTELLLPESLLHADSLINKLISDLEESNFEDVEVIGWLYQYYISEKKNEVFEGLRKNKKITKENIPAATQLFTPHWIVRYMVENSVGQMWLENHPESEIKKDMTYYVQPAEQEEDVQKKLDELRNPNIRPEDITVLDPACGSGHILVYAFELLYKIYEERGYSQREIPTLIIENNLYGIDIDDRATQLASFALLMKAREKSKRIFRNPPKLNVISIKESNDVPIKVVTEVLGKTEEEKKEVQALLEGFIDAKNFGSILQPEKIDFDTYLAKIDELQLGTTQLTAETFEVFEQIEEIQRLLLQGEILSSQYDVVITNPPYMGTKGMNPKLSEYVKKYYKDSKADLYGVFIERTNAFTKTEGFTSTINQHSWMFLNGYEKLRTKLLRNITITSMLHIGTRGFDDISGEVVQSTSYVLRKARISEYISSYYRLVDYSSSDQKQDAFLKKQNVFNCKSDSFEFIPKKPIAYWCSKTVLNIFIKFPSLGEYGKAFEGLKTGNNNLYIKYWFEINASNATLLSNFDRKNSKESWIPLNKGGTYRKWYGNREFVVYWEKNGEEIRNSTNSSLTGEAYYFKRGITWTDVTSRGFSSRLSPEGCIFETAGSTLFLYEDKNYFVVQALLSTKIPKLFLDILNPTLHCKISDLLQVPICTNIFLDEQIKDRVKRLGKESIGISKLDWDYYETSWDFKQHPFLIYKQNVKNLKESFESWGKHAENRFCLIQQNEEELNRIFIDLYGLQDELIPEVPDEEITVRRADRECDAKSFLSYCIGLMMGRYSLDVEGLAYAGGEWDSSRYLSFKPDEDGILPITENVYFEDDVVSRLEDILVNVFGEETLAENLRWLAESLTMKSSETPVERLRRYFFDEFYKDHCKIYSKRPIYWLVDSGKKKGFRALVYLHRYNTDTLAKVRFQYVQDLQEKLRAEQRRLDPDLVNPDLTTAMKKRYEKQLTTIKSQQDELVTFDKKLAELANQRIALDLDDGVVINYAKLQDVLSPIK